MLAVGKVAADQQARAHVRVCGARGSGEIGEKREEKEVRRTQPPRLARLGRFHVSHTRPARLVQTASCEAKEPQCESSRSSSAR